jgi:hypothetical protein
VIRVLTSVAGVVFRRQGNESSFPLCGVYTSDTTQSGFAVALQDAKPLRDGVMNFVPWEIPASVLRQPLLKG